MKKVTVKDLVHEFADNVAAQTDCISRGDAKTGNKHANQCINAFDKICKLGDNGRDELKILFKHKRRDVRVAAAAFLLRHCTIEARSVLEDIARGQGFPAFSAQEAIKRWDEGTWSLDLPDSVNENKESEPSKPKKKNIKKSEYV